MGGASPAQRSYLAQTLRLHPLAEAPAILALRRRWLKLDQRLDQQLAREEEPLAPVLGAAQVHGEDAAAGAERVVFGSDGETALATLSRPRLVAQLEALRAGFWERDVAVTQRALDALPLAGVTPDLLNLATRLRRLCEQRPLIESLARDRAVPPEFLTLFRRVLTLPRGAAQELKARVLQPPKKPSRRRTATDLEATARRDGTDEIPARLTGWTGRLRLHRLARRLRHRYPGVHALESAWLDGMCRSPRDQALLILNVFWLGSILLVVLVKLLHRFRPF